MGSFSWNLFGAYQWGCDPKFFRAVVRLRPTTYLVSCTMGVAGESDKMAAWLKVETELKQLVTRRGGKRQSATGTADVILNALSEEDLNNCCSYCINFTL